MYSDAAVTAATRTCKEGKEQATPTGVETFSDKTWAWSNGKQKEPLARDTKKLFVHAAQLNLLLFLRQRELKRCTEILFLNLLRAQDSISRNRIRQPM
jgi:hypothetical protein